jgi:hypothetical protein
VRLPESGLIVFVKIIHRKKHSPDGYLWTKEVVENSSFVVSGLLPRRQRASACMEVRL